MVNFFKRLFGADDKPEMPESSDSKTTTTPEPPTTSPEVTTPAITSVTAEAGDSSVSTSATKPLKEDPPTQALPTTATLNNHYGDGATRPLSEDTLIAFLGNGHLTFGQSSDVGMVRTNNQDAVYSFFSTLRSSEERPDFGLFIVADGMGGHHDGEKASAVTARTVAQQVLSTIFLPMITGDTENQPAIAEALTAAIEKANAEVIRCVPDGGTTLTTACVVGDLAYIAHVGDSRIYMIVKDNIDQLTRDHSLVQRLIELDQLTPAEAAEHPNKNMLYRALGQNELVEIDMLTRRLPPKARLLLCSDGLWNQVENNEMLDIVTQASTPQDACNKLVALANKRGGGDNISVVLLTMPG